MALAPALAGAALTAALVATAPFLAATALTGAALAPAFPLAAKIDEEQK